MPKKTFSPKNKSDNRELVDTAIIDKLPPHDLKAERGIIGAILLDNDICDDVIEVVKPDDFYGDANRRLYENIIKLRNDGGKIDHIILLDQLEKSGELEAIGEDYIIELFSPGFVTAHATSYAHIVRDKSTLRKLIHTSAKILSDAYQPETPARDILNQASEEIFAVCESRSQNNVQGIDKVIFDTMTLIDNRLKGMSDGIMTGFKDLDDITGGMHPGELIILAARPSIGKTAFALNIAEHVAVDNKIPTLFVSLEMQATELAQRLLCSRGEIDSHKFRGQFINGNDRKQLISASNEIGSSPLFVDDSAGRTVAEIAAVARRLKRKYEQLFIVVDYLGLIEPENSKDPRQEQVAKIARRMKGIARELKSPIMCLAQLNRQIEQLKGKDSNHHPQLSHLRESGAIEQDADVVMFVHREERHVSREEAEERGLLGKAEIILAKQRQGRIGNIKLHWIGEYTKFKDETFSQNEAYDELNAANISSDVGADANYSNIDVSDDFS